MARNILLGIGASFVASGFIAWGVLQIKELIMAIADWIRASTARRRERWEREARERLESELREARAKGIQEGRKQGIQEGRREGYEQGLRRRSGRKT